MVVEEDYARSSLGCVAEAGGDWFHCLGRKTEGLECPALYGPSDGYIPFPKSFEVSCARYFSAEKIKHRAKPNWERKGLFHLTGYRSSRKAVRGGTWKQELTQGAGAVEQGSSAYWLTPSFPEHLVPRRCAHRGRHLIEAHIVQHQHTSTGVRVGPGRGEAPVTEMEIPATLRSGHERLHPRLLSPPPCLSGCCPVGLVW